MYDEKWVRELWNQSSNGFMPDWYKAKRYVGYCYRLGIINWKTYTEVLKKIQQVKNRSWMYEYKLP